MINYRLICFIVTFLFTTTLYGMTMEPVIVTSTHLQKEALVYTASVDIYTRQDIEASKASDIYEFLNQFTAITTTPLFGNRFTQKIDMRGYGINDGFQNIVINVNGRRLNNIDLTVQLLSAIPLDTIQRIEVTKGAGAVENGDGANAGVISITTRDYDDIQYKAYTGNFDTHYGSIGAGYQNEKVNISVFGDYYETAGDQKIETSSNNKDNQRSKNGSMDIAFTPSDAIDINLGLSTSDLKINYANSLTQAQFYSDPTQVGKPDFSGNTFVHQELESDAWKLSGQFDINNAISMDASFSSEDKLSAFSTFKADYDYQSMDLAINFNSAIIQGVIGLENFEGDRVTSANTTTKNNVSVFAKVDYQINKHNFTLGARQEKVEYHFNPALGSILENSQKIEAYEVGYNLKMDQSQAIFFNVARSFQAPDVDRFFSYDFSAGNFIFNGFITPMKATTYNLGYQYSTPQNQFKLTVFKTDVSDEIYFNPITFVNTNLDKSRKNGIELFNKNQWGDYCYMSFNYSFIVAKVIRDDIASINNKFLPGVSKHNFKASFSYQPSDKNKFLVIHLHRSSAFALDDFSNTFSQIQKPYHSTDLTYSHQFHSIEFFAKVQNIFDYNNGVWINDDSIYPENFTRSYLVGIKGKI